MTTEILPCSCCHRPTPIDELDGKDDGTGNFTIIECRDCYGPGWAPMNADLYAARHQGDATMTDPEITAIRQLCQKAGYDPAQIDRNITTYHPVARNADDLLSLVIGDVLGAPGDRHPVAEGFVAGMMDETT